MKKLFTILLFILAIFVFGTLQYRLVCLLLIVLVNNKWIRNLKIIKTWKYTYICAISVLLLLIYLSLPNYFNRGRFQLHYLDRNGNSTLSPLSAYLMNVLLPEEEVVNLSLKAIAITPVDLVYSVSKEMSLGLSRNLCKDAQKDFWSGKFIGVRESYNNVPFTNKTGSFVYAQICNEYWGTDYDAVYITKPKNFDSTKKYPIVFVCHGLLGSWELYQGIFANLENCFVVGLGTKKLDGLSFNIGDISNKYMPYLESLGYPIDKKQIHIVGISNGVSASNIALKKYDALFRSISFIVGPCLITKKSNSKVILVGGGKDRESRSLSNTYDILRNKGIKTALFFNKDANHLMLISYCDEIVDFLNREMSLVR